MFFLFFFSSLLSSEVTVLPPTLNLPVVAFAFDISLTVFAFALPVRILKIFLISNKKNKTIEIIKTVSEKQWLYADRFVKH